MVSNGWVFLPHFNYCRRFFAEFVERELSYHHSKPVKWFHPSSEPCCALCDHVQRSLHDAPKDTPGDLYERVVGLPLEMLLDAERSSGRVVHGELLKVWLHVHLPARVGILFQRFYEDVRVFFEMRHHPLQFGSAHAVGDRGSDVLPLDASDMHDGLSQHGMHLVCHHCKTTIHKVLEIPHEHVFYKIQVTCNDERCVTIEEPERVAIFVHPFSENLVAFHGVVLCEVSPYQVRFRARYAQLLEVVEVTAPPYEQQCDNTQRES